ncbi:MAG: AraC family transcriptional regulator [Nitrospinota bacterium]|nr:AraC family transcriptional regulator [Nitrospinota bacterium]
MTEKLELHFNIFGPRIDSDYRKQLFQVSVGKNLAEAPGSPMKIASVAKEVGSVGLVTHFKPEGDICPDVEVKSKVVCPDGGIHLAMQLVGGAMAGVDGDKGSKFLNPGEAILFVGGDDVLNGRILPGPMFETISLSLSGGFLQRALEPDMAPRPLRKALASGPLSAPELSKIVLSSVARRLAREMVSNPYHGAVEGLYLQGKILELMAELAAADTDGNNSTYRQEAIKGKVMDARDILLNAPENPPSALELSAMVGVGYKTLNRAFLKHLNMTITQFALGACLDHARKTLAETGLTVAEVAHRCGYSSPATFITAYKRRFGHTPGKDRSGMPFEN